MEEMAMVGRHADRERLQRTLGSLVEGKPPVALVAGEAGIGKSRLVMTVATDLVADGMRVLIGHGLPMQVSTPPYAALTEALRGAPERLAAQPLDVLTGEVSAPRARLFDLLHTLVGRLASRKPTVLVIEDLHWVDAATRDALLYLLTTVRTGRWALLATYRASEVRRRPALRDMLEQLHRTTAVEQVHLGPLSRDQVRSMVATLTDVAAPDPALVDRVHRRSDGVPLYVEELVAAERSGVRGVPVHLRDVFLGRLDGLSPEALELVRTAAVVGPSGPLELLASAVGSHVRGVTTALEEAITAGCLAVEGHTVGFRHELLREVVYDDLVPAARQERHEAVGGALAELGGSPEACAHHWYEAGNHELAGQAAAQAALAAERVHAHAAAHAHFERVLGLWEALPASARELVGDRPSVLAHAGEAAYLAGQFPRAVVLASQAVEAVEGPDRSTRLERLARYAWGAGNGQLTERAYEQALESLSPDSPPSVRVQVLSSYGWWRAVTSFLHLLPPVTVELMAAAAASGAPLDRCRALLVQAWTLDGGAAARRAGREALDLARSLDADEDIGRAHVLQFYLATRRGSATEQLAAAQQAVDDATVRNMDRNYRILFEAFETEALLDLGRWDEAAANLDRSVDLHADGMPAQFALARRARLAAARGDADALRIAVDRVVRLGEATPQQPLPRVVALTAEAEHLLWSQDPDAALAVLDRASALFPVDAWFADMRAWLAATRARALADLVRSGRVRAAEDDHTRVGTTDVPDGSPPWWVCLLEAERHRQVSPDQASPWQQAVEGFRDRGDPYRTGYCQWRLAGALLAGRGAHGRARELLVDAATTARSLGAAPLLAEVERLARTHRVRLDDAATASTDDPPSSHGLTPRELQVLHLMADGRTNVEIGEILVISPRTVGVHISRILRKLGAGRRTEAAAIARREGLLDD